MKTIFILVVLTMPVIFSNCANSSGKHQQGQNLSVLVNDSVKDALKSDKLEINTKHKRIDAKLEGVYDIYDRDFQELADSLKIELLNLTISFCGDTIIINGDQKALFTRYTVSTKNMFRQATGHQSKIFKYFGKRAVNVSDSIDYFSISDFSDNWQRFVYTEPGIIYERPYLIVPFHFSYMVSFIVDIEPTKNNRVMPKRRKR